MVAAIHRAVFQLGQVSESFEGLMIGPTQRQAACLEPIGPALERERATIETGLASLARAIPAWDWESVERLGDELSDAGVRVEAIDGQIRACLRPRPGFQRSSIGTVDEGSGDQMDLWGD